MSKFRKKPVVIEAFQVGSSRFYPEWLHEAVSANVVVTYAQEGSDGWKEPFDHADIQTPEGVMRADRGDWIIRGVEGELYPCKDSIFRKIYEPAEDEEPPAQQPTINVVFRCEDNDVVGTTSHQPIHSVRQEDDGSFTVALDYWPTPTRLPAQPRRPYGTDTMSEYGVIPECDGPKPPAHEELEAVRQGWIRVVDEFLVTRHLGIASPTDTYDEARAKLLKIINFEIDIATDPVVGGDRVRKGESNA